MPLSPRTLRPANNFTPRSISGLALWLDASDASTLFQDVAATTPATATSDPVGAWLDKSGNARHATQSTAGSRPLVGAVVANGRRGVNFGTTSNAQRIGWLPGSGDQNWRELIAVGVYDLSASTFADLATVFSGYNTNAGTALGIGISGEAGANAISLTYGSFLPESNINATQHVAGTLVRPFPAIASPFVIIGRSTTVNAVAGYVVGNDRQFSSGRNWRGRISEVIAFERALTLAERSKILRYLASKYGITLAPQVSNADAQDWINRVYANGGTVSSSTAAAVNAFCDSIDYGVGGVSIRDRFYRLNLFCGGTSGTAVGLNACMVPLYRGQSLSGTQYGGTTDTNVGSLFVSANYSESTGLSTTAAGGQYLNTGLTPNDMALADVQAMHLAASHGPIASTDLDHRQIGTHGPSDRFSFVLSIRSSATGQLGVAMGKTNQLNSASIASGSQPSASWIGSRTSATSLVIYKNGTADATLATSVTGIAAHAFPFFVGRINNSGSPLGDSANLPHRHYSIGGALTAAQVLAYQSALVAFNTAMGRTA
jgi:hypothetical protein